MNALILLTLLLLILGVPWLRARFLLSKAKHRSVAGHARLSKALAKWTPNCEYDEAHFFASDNAPHSIVHQRKAGFHRLALLLRERHSESIRLGQHLSPLISDLQFTSRYRVPFQYSRYVREHIMGGSFVIESTGVMLKDIDGNDSYDLAGSYGVNVFGNDFYKDCIDAGIDQVRRLGPVLGPYHPIIEENVQKLKLLSGLDEVSFHMSGTEAVMQAVRLARYHTHRSHVVCFCGAYHGWWDGVQPGIGNPRPARDVYVLKDMDLTTLKVLRHRRDIACVLVNPLQALHPNSTAPSDGTLINSARAARFDRQAYTEWLRQLRAVCTERGIVLIFDEVFVGFRIAYRGAQEYFNIQADLATYGKTLGGGLPVGVVCGKHHLMKRYREDRPTDVCFARGTFNSHPYIIGAMNAFLHRIEQPQLRKVYDNLDATWDGRAHALNQRLAAEDLPVRVANLSSIFTVLYTRPARYNWMLQFYLRTEGLMLSWVGSGRLIFSLNYTEQDFTEVAERLLRAVRRMNEDGYWWHPPAMSNRSIQHQILGELLKHRFGGALRIRPSNQVRT